MDGAPISTSSQRHPGLWIRRETAAEARAPKSAHPRLALLPRQLQHNAGEHGRFLMQLESIPTRGTSHAAQPCTHCSLCCGPSTRQAAWPTAPACCAPSQGHDFSAAMQAALSPPALRRQPSRQLLAGGWVWALRGAAWLPPAISFQGGNHPLSSSSPTPLRIARTR